jgi:HUS1 checkpoint protein
MRTVAERMKTISDTVVLSANLSGKLRMRIESDLANVETQWDNLRHPELGKDLTDRGMGGGWVH